MSGVGDGYVGNAEDSARIARMSKKRDKERKDFEEQQKQRQQRIETAGVRKFAAATSEAIEHAFKNETIGLVTKAEFMKKRETLQERLEEELRAKQEAEDEALQREKDKRKRAKLSAAGRPKLSFADDEEADGDGSPVVSPSGGGGGGFKFGGMKKAKLGKDPGVATDFLPDKDREAQEEALKEQLRKQWQAAQDKIRNEPLEITYSYWDGAGHRRTIKVKKGDTIGNFLKMVREQLSTQFKELRGVSVDNLMYIKEDIILPQHYTFHDLIKNKARGKSGPLFEFGVVEDVRVMNDASQEKGDSHAGKVVERHWYDRNKHIFPANRWELYDPEKKWDSYTIHDYVEKH